MSGQVEEMESKELSCLQSQNKEIHGAVHWFQVRRSDSADSDLHNDDAKWPLWSRHCSINIRATLMD